MLMALKAADLGLSTCWVDVFDPKAVSKVLSIDEGIQPQVILTVGYAYEKPVKDPQKIPLKRITSFNKYGDRTVNVNNWAKEKYSDKLKKLIKKLKK